MKTAPLGELTEPVKTWNPSREPDSEFHYIDLSAVDNTSKSVTAATPTVGSDAPSRARQLVAAGDVLVSTVRPNLNAVAVVPPELNGATASTGFTVLRPTAELDGRFLFHWVRSPEFIADMVRKATGASYPAVSDRIVKGSTIPATPVPEQRRIAAILDHADALRTKRRQVRAQLDSLAQSIFNSMFGEQLTSADRTEFRELASLITKGTTPTSVGLKFTSYGVPFLRAQNLQQGTVRFAADDLFIDQKSHLVLKRSVIRPGDVLISIAGTIGRVAIVPESAEEMNCNQAVAIVRLLDPSIGTWLMSWLNSRDAQRQIRASAVTATISNLSLSQIGQLKVPTPGIAAIHAFARRVERVRASEMNFIASDARFDEVFASLQSRAFRGEL